ncbi:MAG: hypothetical protein K9M97_11715, partial [Akkermansiaceae bacterium]|nr:hypothetical protein [Akkermansiaceae bacterium]
MSSRTSHHPSIAATATRLRSGARGISARIFWWGVYGIGWLAGSLAAQTYIDPGDALGIWDFNNAAIPTQASDLMQN